MMIGTTLRRLAQRAARRRGRSGPAPSATSSSTTSKRARSPRGRSPRAPSATAVTRWPSRSNERVSMLAQRRVVVDDEDVERRGGLHALTVAPRAGHRTRAKGLARKIRYSSIRATGRVHALRPWTTEGMDTPRMSFAFGQDGGRRSTRQRADGSIGERRNAVCVRLRHQLEPDRAPVLGGRWRACLTPAPPPDAGTGLTSTAAAASPDRRSLYVVNQDLGHACRSSTSPSTGTLDREDPGFRRHRPRRRSPWPSRLTAVTPTSSTRATSTVSTYDVDAAGALTLASERRHATGQSPLQIALSPDGASAYVTNFSGGTVSQYDVSAAGALTPKSSGHRRGRVAAGRHRRQPRWRQRLRHQPGRRAAPSRSSRSTPASGDLTPEGSRHGRRRHPAARHRRGRRTASTWPTWLRNTISQYTADGAGALSELAPPVATVEQPVRTRALARRHAASTSPPFTERRRRPVRRGRRRNALRQGRAARTGRLPPAGRGRGQAARRAGADHRPPHAARGRAVRRWAPTSTADYSCADEGGSGLASCTGDVADGAPLDTSTPGAHAFTVVARDGEGNETTVTHGYSVAARRAGADRRSAYAAGGRAVRAGRRRRADYSCADEGGSRPRVVHGRRGRRRAAGHLDAGRPRLHGRRA